MTNIEKSAAQELINRAFSAVSITIALFLIDAALRLDNSLDVAALKKQVTEKWMTQESKTRGL